jgi:hypothetical protein
MFTKRETAMIVAGLRTLQAVLMHTTPTRSEWRDIRDILGEGGCIRDSLTGNDIDALCEKINTAQAMDKLATEWCKARGIIPGLTRAEVKHAQYLAARIEECAAVWEKKPEGAGSFEWLRLGDEADERRAEYETSLAEMFCNILPSREKA